MNRAYIIVTVIVCLIANISMSQNTGDGNTFGGDAEGARVTIKSNKISEMPQSRDSVMEIPKIIYYLEPAQHEVNFEVEPIKPARLKIVEPLEKLYAGYVKAGIGNYTTPYVEAYYNSTRSKKNSWGIDLLHHSSLGSINDLGVNKFSDNHLGGFYKHFLRKHTLYTSLNYDRNAFHYYGFTAADTLIPEIYRTTDDTTKQAYHLISFSSELKSMFKDSARLNHVVGLDYNYLNGLANTHEHNIVVDANLFKYLGKEEIGADIALDINALKQQYVPALEDTSGNVIEDPTTNNTIFEATPYIFSRGDNWAVKAGLSIYANIGNAAKFHFYPDVEANYSLFNDIFIPYVGLTGGIKRNSFNSLRLENPFILENAVVQNTNQKLKIYGGIRGSVSSTISFNLAVGHEVLDGLAIFGADSLYSYENKFSVMYDTLSRTTISGQLAYQKLEKLKLYGKGEYFAYSSGRKEFAWHQPDYKFTLSGTYDLADKILIRANVFVIGTRKSYSYLPIDGVEALNGKYIFTLKPFVDANLGFEYRYNKKLSAFVNFNNLAGKKYLQWSNYPVQSFQVLGGVTFSF